MHERACAARCRDASAQDNLSGVAVRIDPAGHALGRRGQFRLLEQRSRQGEDAFHVCLLGAWTHDPWAGLAAHQQVKRMGEDRLPCSGLPRDRVELRSEAQLGPLDQKQVLNSQLPQHARCLTVGRDGFAPSAAPAELSSDGLGAAGDRFLGDLRA